MDEIDTSTGAAKEDLSGATPAFEPVRIWGVKLGVAWLRNEEGKIRRFTESEASAYCLENPEAMGEPRRLRGFAVMDRRLVSEIARKGGIAGHAAGTAHEFTHEKAKEAGSLGGRAAHAARRRAMGTSEPPK